MAQESPQVHANKLNGSLGGKARAKNLSAKRKKQIASAGGSACAKLYGKDFFKQIRKKAKTVGRYRNPIDNGQTEKQNKKSK